MLDLDSKKTPALPVKIGGKVYQVRRPTMGESRMFESEMGNKKAKTTELTMQFLEKLGLPIDVADALDIDQMTALSDALHEKKKDLPA